MSKSVQLFADELRARFAKALSTMYQAEVPQYASLCSLVKFINDNEVAPSTTVRETLESERHGAIRLGSANELMLIRRLFALMGMFPVDYYDLSIAGIPVHSSAFRPLELDSLQKNSFRVFTSLLRLDLIEDNDLRQLSKGLLSKRNIFSHRLKSLISLFETQGDINDDHVKEFIDEALEVFRWHQDAQVDRHMYQILNKTHRLITDIVSFKGPHINHLTRHCLNIDELQTQLSNYPKNGFDAKDFIEGPPKRKCPILLRQTSFLALKENIRFNNGEKGTHTARFGEVEQRGVALTPKGRQLYDEMLNNARQNKDEKLSFTQKLEYAFRMFPDEHRELHDKKLAYYQYSIIPDNQYEVDMSSKQVKIEQLLDQRILQITPVLYEDFLPVSAAGIFASNLSASNTKQNTEQGSKTTEVKQSPNQAIFEKALGCSVINSFSLYEKIQKDSLNFSLATLGID